jgi:Tfp pilus assembly protein FimT
MSDESRLEHPHLEHWALARAHTIMVHEGMNLMNAAQWLDKQQMIRSSQKLRDAIRQSLLEAVTLQAEQLSNNQASETR